MGTPKLANFYLPYENCHLGGYRIAYFKIHLFAEGMLKEEFKT
jgi:hypothetical protein